jgi:transcriptional regulator with XRE-family HTH domain
MNYFLEQLKDELNYQCFTQKELSEKTNISINTIRGWFSKDLVPDVFSATKVAKALNTTVEFLVTGKEENLTQEETELLSNYRKLDADTKKIINLQVAAVANVLKSK